jgi:hypothetical protein
MKNIVIWLCLIGALAVFFALFNDGKVNQAARQIELAD